MSFQLTWKFGIIILGILLAVSYALYSYKTGSNPLYEYFVEANTSSKVKTDKRDDILVSSVKAIPKDAIKKVELPESVEKDKNKVVTAVVDVPKSEAGHTVASILDTNTGISSILIKPNKPPFFSLLSENRLGIRYGITSKGATEGELYYSRGLARIADAHIGTYGSISSKGEAKVMLQVEYRW